MSCACLAFGQAYAVCKVYIAAAMVSVSVAWRLCSQTLQLYPSRGPADVGLTSVSETSILDVKNNLCILLDGFFPIDGW